MQRNIGWLALTVAAVGCVDFDTTGKYFGCDAAVCDDGGPGAGGGAAGGGGGDFGGNAGGGAAGGGAAGGGAAGGGAAGGGAAGGGAVLPDGGCAVCAAPLHGSAACVAGRCEISCTAPAMVCGDACCKYVQVSAGSNHTCALSDLGRVTCWGEYLGVGAMNNALRPLVKVERDAVGVSTGMASSCAWLNDGGTLCWGFNGGGVLGSGTLQSVSKAMPVVDLGPVKQVSVGQSAACAVERSGGVQCWGTNSQGEQGIGEQFPNRLTPGPVPGFTSGVREVSVGFMTVLALLDDGGTHFWGANYGVYEHDAGIKVFFPLPTHLDGGAVAISSGLNQSCALRAEGTVDCFGVCGDGLCGDGVVGGPANGTGRRVKGLTRVTSLATSSGAGLGERTNACAVEDGGLWCWGENKSGQVGDGTVVERRLPWLVPLAGLQVRGGSVGTSHACAVTTEGSVWCWGKNDRGQLGDGTTTSRYVPTLVR